ncbi:MAG: MBL fold metallo-hydrolase [Desulfitobacterium sp.]
MLQLSTRVLSKYLLLILITVFLTIGCSQNNIVQTYNTGIEYIGYGANKTVSGSLHIISIDGEKIMLDAGSFYGDDENQVAEFPKELLKDISAIVISHAHLDHTGRLLEIVNMGYKKPILCTEPTKELMTVMLRMSAKYGDFGQEEFYYSNGTYNSNNKQNKDTAVHIYKDCQYGKNIKSNNIRTLISKRKDLEEQGLYLCGECANLHVQKVMRLVKTLPLHKENTLVSNISIELFNTPHLPGSVMVKLKSMKSGESVLFTGDLGSGLSPYLPEQDIITSADYAIVEGTYGNDSTYISPEDRIKFQQYIGDCVRKNKRIIIPAFVLDRSQQVLYEITKGMQTGYIPTNTPVKVFGTSTADINKIYSTSFTKKELRSYFSQAYSKDGPFGTIFNEYGQLENVNYGEIAVASSGMADSVYSKEFVKQWIPDPETVFIFVGYQDPDTIGGKLTSNEPLSSIEIDSNDYESKAQIKKFSCFSGHANYIQVKNLIGNIDNLDKVLVVHVEEESIGNLIESYNKDFPNIRFFVPESGELLRLTK